MKEANILYWSSVRQDSRVFAVTRLQDGRPRYLVPFPGRGKILISSSKRPDEPAAHPVSHPMSAGCSLPVGELDRTWSCPFTTPSAHVTNEWSYTYSPPPYFYDVRTNKFILILRIKILSPERIWSTIHRKVISCYQFSLTNDTLF